MPTVPRIEVHVYMKYAPLIARPMTARMSPAA